MVDLNLANISKLGTKVAVPKYARSALSPGIVHIGVGNFHRAHLAVYLDDLFNMGLNQDWAITGAGVMPSDEAMRQKLASQDFLTTVVEQEATVSKARVTGSMIDFISPGDRARLVETLANRETRIVSLTVTEGGYMIDPATGKFDPKHPALQRDAQNPEDPTTAFGLILRGLKLRRERGLQPYTVMSCDNLPHNGVVTRNAVTGLAELMDPEFAAWVKSSVAFPNGMVDRITPATSDRERKVCAEEFGVEDQWPVFCEEFKQWVVEDNFPLGRPAWEKVGAQFVKDVTPWEYMKIRILNGGHAVIAYIGGLMDIHFVHEAMETPLIRDYLKKVTDDEIRPTVLPVPGTDLQDYQKLIERRFANPKIGDTIRRLCLDGSNRQPKFIVPPIADRLKDGKPIFGLALESALWCRYCFGITDSGKVIEANDPNWNALQAQARLAKTNPQAWLDMAEIYGEVGKHPVMQRLFAGYLEAIWKNGAEATVKTYLVS
jgi:mannitol 2-dehydrogenase